jgi:hypothetical protein
MYATMATVEEGKHELYLRKYVKKQHLSDGRKRVKNV